MKKFLLTVLAALICLSFCSCSSLLGSVKSLMTGEAISKPPEDFVAKGQNDDYSYEVYKSYIKVTKYISENTEAVIPEEIDGKPVKVIGSLCFYQTTEVTSVQIPDSVEIIESQAFYCATKLLEVTIPDGVESIGERAFAWCTSLENVILGKGISEISNYCFNSCSSLEKIEFTDEISQIGLRSFSYCEKLSEINIPANVTKIGDRAFENCTMLKFATLNNPSVELGELVFVNSPDVAVISEKGSSVMDYCEQNALRFSESKDIAATVIGGETSSETSND